MVSLGTSLVFSMISVVGFIPPVRTSAQCTWTSHPTLQSTTISAIFLESLSDKTHTHFNLSNFMVRVFSALRRYFRIVGISFTMVTSLEAGWKVDLSSPCVHRKSLYHVGQTVWHHDDHSLVILHHICNLHELKLVPKLLTSLSGKMDVWIRFRPQQMFAAIENGKKLMKHLSSTDHSLGSIGKCRDDPVSGLRFVSIFGPPTVRVTSPSHANPNKSRSSTVKEGAKMTPTVTFILIDFQRLYCTSMEN